MGFSDRKYAEMHFVYGSCDRNVRAALRVQDLLFKSEYSSPQVFTRLHQCMIESGCAQKQQNEVGSALDFYVDYQILLRVEEVPENSSRRLALEI